MAVQINGKLRAAVRMPRDCENADMIAAAKADPKIAAALEGVSIDREIAVRNKIVNFVVRPGK